MLTLAIEATNPNIPTPGVLLADGDRVLAERGLETKSRHDDVLLPAIADLLRRCSATATDLEEIVVSIGPGGFTATRLACVAAAMLAELSSAKLLAVPTAMVAAASLESNRKDSPRIVVVMACKGEQAFVARVDSHDPANSLAGRSMSSDAFAGILGPDNLLLDDGRMPASFESIAADASIERAALSLTARGLLASRSRGAVVSPEMLRPIYPREPDAVTQWRRRHGSPLGDPDSGSDARTSGE